MSKTKKIKRTWADDKKLISELEAEKKKLICQLQTPINTAEQINQLKQEQPKFELTKIDSSWRLENFMQEFFAKGVRLASRKNHDYAGNGDPFFNFRRFGVQGFIVRMGDKFARLETLATHGYLAVIEESYQDTLIDIANYAALLAAFLYNQRIEVEESNAKSR